jgi:hypothetical protein
MAKQMFSDAGRRYKSKRVNTVLSRELQNNGIVVTIGEKHSATHLLMHAYANCLWVLGIPLIRIAHMLGHQSVFTTVTTYLHVAPFLQRELLLKYSRAPISFATSEIAALSGVGERRIRQIIYAQKISGSDLNNAIKLLDQIYSL